MSGCAGEGRVTSLGSADEALATARRFGDYETRRERDECNKTKSWEGGVGFVELVREQMGLLRWRGQEGSGGEGNER